KDFSSSDFILAFVSANKLAIESLAAVNNKLLEEVETLKTDLEHYKSLAANAEKARAEAETKARIKSEEEKSLPDKTEAKAPPSSSKPTGAPFKIPAGQEL
ncbi:hypothetical protein ACFL1X_14735, partial [Candidatus Hydrogenedentota bacterium]